MATAAAEWDEQWGTTPLACWSYGSNGVSIATLLERRVDEIASTKLMVSARNRTPLEPGKYLAVAASLALGIVEGMSTGDSSLAGNVSRHHPRRTTLLKRWIIAKSTTLSWERIARHMFGDEFTVTAFLIERIVALSSAAQPFTFDASGNHLAFTASLIFTVVQRVTTTFRHAFAEWSQAGQNDTVTTARLDKRVVDPFIAATAGALTHAIWALTLGEIRSWSKLRPSFHYICKIRNNIL